MTPHNIAALINLVGFITGAVLYGMLLIMLLRSIDQANSTRRLLLATALLGLLWNLGAQLIYGARDWHLGEPSLWLEATVFSALGFLPAVVVHSALINDNRLAQRSGRNGARLIIFFAYALSASAGILHFYSAATGSETPSQLALRSLTLGFSGLTVAIVFYARRSSLWKRAFRLVALAVFAVSALHISRHTGRQIGGDRHWLVELIGHHASLPLVIAMLYEDYRFALADIFLKRALALLALVAAAFGLYVFAAAPLLRMRDVNGDLDPRAVGVLLGLWIATALAYPWMRRAVEWVVDAIVLRRADYQELRDELAASVASIEDTEEILNIISMRLKSALTSSDIHWRRDDATNPQDIGRSGDPKEFVLSSRLVQSVNQDGHDTMDIDARPGNQWKRIRARRTIATVLIPTHEPPRYSLLIGELSGGRRLLSDDILLLESLAIMAARRVDAVRVIHERCERNLREQEIGKLATEAELRALRAQLNPHFLFNALTTIGYLIQTAPERAFETLMKLTGLLRAVLRAPANDFVTLGEEIDLIESYLAIERARFEERLRVMIDVPEELRGLRIPALLVQPLVENAIKHGIAQSNSGGDVIVSAKLENNDLLKISIRDTGRGADMAVNEFAFAAAASVGVGLANVQRRLECHYGESASLKLMRGDGSGTAVELRMPL